MGRRLNLVIGAALAVAALGLGLAARTASARQDQPSPGASRADQPLDPPPATKPKGAKGSKPSRKAAAPTAPAEPPPAELPPDFLPVGRSPSNLGPEPTPYPAAEPEADAGKVGRAAPPRPRAPDSGATPGTGRAASPAPVPAPEATPEGLPEMLPAAPVLPAPAGSDAPAPAPPPLSPPAEPAPRGANDPAVERVQAAGTPPAGGARRPPTAAAPGPPPGSAPAPAADTGPLPPAVERPGQPAVATAAAGAPREPEPSFVLAPEKLPLGRQGVGLTVEVIGPHFLNLNQNATLKVVVRNTGASDARGVVVRDTLPPNVTYVASQPEATKIDALLSWNVGDLAAGSERIVTLTVRPTAVGPFDHAATVTMAAGARSRTVVREPKLKIEQTVNSGKALRGQPVQFKIAVSNPGDGPARNVIVQAKLSPGLKHESGEPNDQNLFEQTIDEIGPGVRVTLDTLVADTVLGGEQTCTVVAGSPDVAANSPDARSVQTVTVVEPRLTLKVSGDKDRYTDTLATYTVTLENPGTAPARNVRVVATLPVSGKLQAPLPPGARFDTQTRKLTWSKSLLDAGEKAEAVIQVRMGGPGLYSVAAEARADGGVPAVRDVFQTDVTGLADVTIDVTEKSRVVDVDGVTTFVIRVVNSGTKEATNLSISAVHSDNVEPIDTKGTDEQAKHNLAEHKVVFPLIPRLGPGKAMELGIRVKAIKPGTGLATCRVFLLHADLPEKLEDVAAFKIAPTRR